LAPVGSASLVPRAASAQAVDLRRLAPRRLGARASKDASQASPRRFVLRWRRLTSFVARATRYLVHERLAAGGMGAVFRGTMQSAAGERQVAIKQLLDRAEDSPDARDRLVAEARLVFQLTHANICQVLDLGENQDGTFVVMELVDGLDWGALSSYGRVEPAWAVYVAREVARALDYAHRRVDRQNRPLLLVHGDVTPRNILVSREGEVKLADFGLARALGATAPGNRLRAGTRGFAAPEVEEGRVVDQRADIFSLGQVLRASLSSHVPPSPSLLAILERATATAPEDRFSTAAELEARLGEELARKHATFSPSQLGHAVRELAETTVPERSPAVVAELGSLAHAIQRAPVEDEPAARRTHTVDGRRAPVLSVALAGVAVAAAAALLGLRWVHKKPPAPRPTPTAIAIPTSVPTPPPLPAPTPPPPTPIDRAPTPAPVPTAATPRFGYLTVSSNPWGAVYIDHRLVAEVTPVYRLRLPVGAHRVAVRFTKTGRASTPQTVVIHAGASKTVGFHL
jgi:serine/threonine protein kinase